MARGRALVETDHPDDMRRLSASSGTEGVVERLERELQAIRSQLETERARHREEVEKADRVRDRYHFLAGSTPQIMWSALADGWPDYYNRHWWDYTGLPYGLVEWTWDRVLHPADINRVRTTWERSVRAGKGFQIECRLRRASDGAYRWHRVEARPKLKENGEVDIWIGTATDVD